MTVEPRGTQGNPPSDAHAASEVPHVDGPAPDRSLTAIGELLESVIDGFGGGSPPPLLVARQHWGEAAGARWSAHGRPIDVRDGCLVVEMEDPTNAALFRYDTRAVLARLTARAPDLGISRIAVRVRRSDTPSRSQTGPDGP